MPLGMNLQRLGTPHTRPANNTPVLLWNQRWAFDKNPEGLLNLLTGLDASGVDFHLIVTGRAAGRTPDPLRAIRTRFQDRLLHMGFVEDIDVYTELLHRADIVVSTAHHEFFGLAVMEAIRCGCHPVLPNRLSYPELIPERLHDPLLHAPTLYDTPDDALTLCTTLLDGTARPLPPRTLHAIPDRFDWSTRAPVFDDAFAALR
jgi:glycosyltransferase involved in cell wall biosynthesis